MSTLFLDDSKERCKAIKSVIPYITIVHTVEECIEKLKEEEWDLVFLDHDLGNEIYVDSKREDTGMEVVRWIIKNQPIIRHIIVHTLNTSAGIVMAKDLNKAKYEAVYLPYTQLIKTLSKGNKND